MNTARTALVTGLALALIATPARAQRADSSLAQPWTREVIQSKKLGTERPIFVVTPSSYRWMSPARYPVLLLLDADDDDQFAAARANIAFLAGRGAIPEIIVVGIPNGKDRMHDLSPPTTGKTRKMAPTGGGADAFVDFLTDEVVPLVQARYRALPTTILAGHSLGGLLGVHVAATHSGKFAGIVAMSPSLQWNDSTLIVPYANAIARSPAKLRLFATSGGLEPVIDNTTRPFAALLDSLHPANVAFKYQRYPTNDHGLTPLRSLVDGLTFVFEPIARQSWPIYTWFQTRLGADSLTAADSAAMVASIVDTESRYARGAATLGLPETLDRGVLNDAGQISLYLKRPGWAVWSFRRNVEKYPEWAGAHNNLANALLTVADSNGARKEFRTAADIGKRNGDTAAAEMAEAKLKALSTPVQAGKPKP